MVIKGQCRTNLDDYDCTITKVFYSVPLKGDFIRVSRKGNIAYLKVVSITHEEINREPFIIIELNN